MNKTVEVASKNNICISCGICKSICPKSCIRYERNKGLFCPIIDSNKCVNCGLCAEVCPGLEMRFEHNNPVDAVYGNIKYCYNAWSKNEVCRFKSASGGVVSTIISKLLIDNKYDSAFVINTYNYNDQLSTTRIVKEDVDSEEFFDKIPKSRYLPVSHENLISYMKRNRGEKIIVVGTSCALQGISRVINLSKLNRDNYLLIGLFCDKVYNYNIFKYYADNCSGNKKLESLHFKNKESGGWPGNMKLFFSDGTYAYLDKSERIKTKDVFMPERCLYCIDKLNVSADISLGDNYTSISSSKKGSNSVIIRTEIGNQIWSYISNSLNCVPVDITDIHEAQYLDGRVDNVNYAKLKDIKSRDKINMITSVSSPGDYVDYEYAWKNKLRKLTIGANYSRNNSMNINDSQSKIKTKIRYIYYSVKRKVLKMSGKYK